MASLLTLPGPQYQAYNTDLANIAMKGIDEQRMDLANREFGESVRQFDATMPLKQQELEIQQGNLDVRQAQESREAEKWDIEGRPMAKAGLGLTSAALDIQARNAALDAEKARFYNQKAAAEADAAANESVDWKTLMTGHKNSFDQVRSMFQDKMSMLNLADSKNAKEDINTLLLNSIPGAQSSGGAASTPQVAGTQRLGGGPNQDTGTPLVPGNSFRNMDPGQYANLQKAAVDTSILEGLAAQLYSATTPLAALKGRVSQAQLEEYSKKEALYQAKLAETIESLNRFDPTKAFAPTSAAAAGAAAAGAKAATPSADASTNLDARKMLIGD